MTDNSGKLCMRSGALENIQKNTCFEGELKESHTNIIDVLSDEGRLVFEMVNFICICTVVSMFGMVTNILNMIIFYKQGFKNTVNIGFFGLAISDLLCLLTLQWASISMNPLFAYLGVNWSPVEVMYLSGGWPHLCFSRITSFITVYITVERYLSIALPLKVKHIITRKTATITISLIYFINIASMFPEYATTYLGWRTVPGKNETILGIMFKSSRKHVEGVIHVLHSLLGMTSFAGVIIFTTLLVSKLRQSSQWRKDVTSFQEKREAVVNRDKKTVKMVVLIASVLIACYIPGAVVALTAYIGGPEFNIKGGYTNICTAVWSIVVVCQSINSSVNICVYYSMSSKYRHTLNEPILSRKC